MEDEARVRVEIAMRLHWEPAIYEHKAALIGETPLSVSRSAELLARSLLAEFEAYEADFMTVGIDVYNLEAESVGAEVSETGRTSCPEVRTPPYDIESFDPPALPDTRTSGRYTLMIEAAKTAAREIGDRARIRVAASGPVSIASKLVGIEPLIIGVVSGDDAATTVLRYAEDLALRWIERIRDEGLEAIVFDSTAAPPVMSPSLYAEHIAPLHRELMRALASRGQHDRPLIIGGNTVPIASAMRSAGATTVICDFPADAHAFAEALGRGDDAVSVRRNIDPALFGGAGDPLSAVEQYAADLAAFARPIAGTGILPYDAEPERFREFRKRTEEVVDNHA